MSTNNRVGNKLPKWADRETTTSRIDTATYVGIVKVNTDPARSGRLRVWIPDLGGNENDEFSWKTVSYASPFFGKTNNPKTADSKLNKWDIAHHTYGMWMVPPDLGNEVLCTFVNGDPDRGYWFACVNTGLASHYMTPGLAASNTTLDTATTDATLKAEIATTSSVPVAEFNENADGSISSSFYYNSKPPHEAQFKTLLEQGLDKDKTRGSVTSSSQRESPSTVFGISTPGRFLKDTATSTDFQGKLEGGTLTDQDYDDYFSGPRVGGHQFVLDDGDMYGEDNLVRLRSAGGHQIMMNDTGKVLYIANSSGSVWMEFGDNGQMYFYSAGGLNIRTEGNLNIHSDKNINMHAKQNINIKSDLKTTFNSHEFISKSSDKTTIYAGGLNLGSTGDFAISAASKGSIQTSGTLSCVGSKIYLNSGGGVAVADPGKITVNVHADTSRDSTTTPWQAVSNRLDSIATIVPSHEPWTRATGGQQGVGGGSRSDQGGPPQKFVGPVDCQGVESTDPGPQDAKGKAVDNPMPREYLDRADAPNPPEGLGPLTQWQMKCVMAQMAYSESRFDYAIKEKNNSHYLGRYQIGALVLVQFGYISKSGYDQYKNSSVQHTDAWTGADNIHSQEEFLANQAVQEKIMFNLMSYNYRILSGNTGIKNDDDLCTVAGMLCVAHLLGAGGAKSWRYTASGADANGASGTVYFNRGRYAIDILANSGPGTPGQNATVAPGQKLAPGGLTPAAKKAAEDNIDPLSVMQFTPYVPGQNTGTGTYERFMQCDEVFRAMVLGAARDYKTRYGEKLVVNSTLRTAEDQTLLYNAWRDAGGKSRQEGGPLTVNTKYGSLSMPLRTPGQHGRGIAIDCPHAQMERMLSLGLFEKYGLQYLGPADPPHAQAPRQ